MQLILAQKCAECRPERFQTQVPTARAAWAAHIGGTGSADAVHTMWHIATYRSDPHFAGFTQMGLLAGHYCLCNQRQLRDLALFDVPVMPMHDADLYQC